MLIRLLCSSLVLLPWVAGASDFEAGVIPVSLHVGEEQILDVGGAMGLVCDDNSVVTSKISTGKTANEVSVTGLKEGTTLCRAGSDALGMKRMMRVRVTKTSNSTDGGPAPADR